jgi:hypothetical protein
VIRRLFRNWRFRAAKPVFAPGTYISAYLTGFEPATGEGEARIGDTRLRVTGATAAQVDTLVELEIESFDARHGTGHAVLRT